MAWTNNCISKTVKRRIFVIFRNGPYYIAENNNNDTILTLGNLFEQDLPPAYILPVYPSPYNDNFRFKNKTKYRIFNDPQTTSDPIRFLVPLRFCCIAGNELPILVHKLPSEFLSAHGKKWLPHFIEPVIKTIDEGIADKNPRSYYIVPIGGNTRGKTCSRSRHALSYPRKNSNSRNRCAVSKIFHWRQHCLSLYDQGMYEVVKSWTSK